MATQNKWFIKGQFKAIDVAMKQKLQVIGELVSSAARRNAPVKTGTLRDSITFELIENGKAVRIGTNVKYAPFLELGTKFIYPRFFLTQAYNENIPKIRNIFAKEIK